MDETPQVNGVALQEYSHDAAVAAITSFCEFVSRMHPDEVSRSLEYPPNEAGWPEITAEVFAPFRKSEAVIRLLQHIPYFVGAGSGEPHCMPDSGLVNYIDSGFLRWLSNRSARSEEELSESQSDEVEPPPYVVRLCIGGTRYGYEFSLDTENAVILLKRMSCQEWHQYLPYGDDDLDTLIYGEPTPPWLDEDTMVFRIPSFFEMIKTQLRIMNWMPALEYNCGHVSYIVGDQQFGHGDAIRKQILEDAGWPGEDGECGPGWDRDKAQKEMEERYDAMWK